MAARLGRNGRNTQKSNHSQNPGPNGFHFLISIMVIPAGQLKSSSVFSKQKHQRGGIMPAFQLRSSPEVYLQVRKPGKKEKKVKKVRVTFS
jgi:hypothetical protein